MGWNSTISRIFFGTFTSKDGGIYERIFFRISSRPVQEPPRPMTPKLLSLLSKTENKPFFSDRSVPAHVLYYGAIQVDIPEMWQELRQSIQRSRFARQREQFFRWLTHIEDKLSINWEYEFLPAFGQEIAVIYDDLGLHSGFRRKTTTLEGFPVVLLFQLINKHVVVQTLTRLEYRGSEKQFTE